MHQTGKIATLVDVDEAFWQRYQIDQSEGNKIIGEGAFSKVKLGRQIETGTKMAIKIIDKFVRNTEKDKQLLQRELTIHPLLNHPNIIRFMDSHQTVQYVYMVLEYAQGGSFFEYVRKRGYLGENEARKYVIQLCEAMKYIHSQKVMHRDLKLENILLDKDNNLKVCDFGWCSEITNDKKLTFCGTYEYMAPEIFLGQPYDESVDIWAMGVIIYEILHGISPFHGPTPQEIGYNVVNRRIQFRQDISAGAYDLINRILHLQGDQRLTLKGICRHPWITGQKQQYQYIQQQQQQQIYYQPYSQIVHLGYAVPPIVNTTLFFQTPPQLLPYAPNINIQQQQQQQQIVLVQQQQQQQTKKINVMFETVIKKLQKDPSKKVLGVKGNDIPCLDLNFDDNDNQQNNNSDSNNENYSDTSKTPKSRKIKFKDNKTESDKKDVNLEFKLTKQFEL